MTDTQHRVFARSDTLLGVCQALGEDFRFNPLWLRAGLGVLLLWNPVVVAGTYAALAVAVLLSRLISPNPRTRTAIVTSDATEAGAQDKPADVVIREEELAAAA